MIEVCGYLLILGVITFRRGSRVDWLILLLMGVCITLTCSQQSYTQQLCRTGKLTSWLAAYSYSLYLGHGFWTQRMILFFPNIKYRYRIALCFLLILATSLIIHYTSILLRRLWKKIRSVKSAQTPAVS